jgi:MFS family permease
MFVRRAADIPHLAALRHRDYRFTWMANMCSGAAMWTFIVAVSWLILEKSDKSGDVGIVTFASMLPFLLVSPIAGLIADRLDRQSIARFTFIANGAITAVVAALAFANVLELWHLSLLTFISGTMRSTQEPAISSLIPNQVPQRDLLNAITLNAATRHGARFFGLLVASPLLAIDAIGVTGVLVLSVAFQAVGTMFMTLTRTRSTGESTPRHGMARSMLDGLVYIYTNRMISIFILLVAFHCALVMSYDSVLPVFSRNELGAVDGSILGYMVMGFGAGSLVVTVLMAGVRSERNKGRWLLWTGVISGIVPIVLAFSPSVAPAILVAAVMGGTQSAFMALTTTYVQTIAPDRLRGRISSLYILHAGGIMAFANLGYGFMADILSAPPILYVTAAAFLIFIFSANATLPDLRRVYRTGQAVAA